MSYTVKSISEAWSKANEIFPTDYIQDDKASARAGYPIYWSTAAGVNAWISDLGSRLEVNLPDGQSINIWIDAPKFYEYEIADALSIISDCIYEIDDKVNSKLADKTGIAAARDLLYGAYAKMKLILDDIAPDSKLYRQYNL